MMRTEDVEGTSEKDGEVAPSTGNTGSRDDALDCSGGRERVKAGKLDALTTSSFAGAERSASTTAIDGCRHTRASCPFALEDRRKMASMEEEKRDAVVEVCDKPLQIRRGSRRFVDFLESGTEPVRICSILFVETHMNGLNGLPVSVSCTTAQVRVSTVFSTSYLTPSYSTGIVWTVPRSVDREAHKRERP